MTLGHDLRDALRQMRRSPGFAAAAVLSLSLGIGANTAIFTLLDQVLLRALTVGEPEQLVRFGWTGLRYGVSAGTPADIEIVGVMKDAKYTTLRDDINPQVFLDDDQNPEILTIHVYMKTALDPQQLYGLVRRTVQGLDATVPVFDMRTWKRRPT